MAGQWGMTTQVLFPLNQIGEIRLLCKSCYLIWKMAQQENATPIFKWPPEKKEER